MSDENGEFDDWIEIYNPNPTDVDLKGYSISDSATKQVIPNSLVVKAGGYVLLWADDAPAQGVAHLGFKLSGKKGDSVTLAEPSGAAVDVVSFTADENRNSYSRYPDGGASLAWCATPTPGASNGSVCAG